MRPRLRGEEEYFSPFVVGWLEQPPRQAIPPELTQMTFEVSSWHCDPPQDVAVRRLVDAKNRRNSQEHRRLISLTCPSVRLLCRATICFPPLLL